MTEEKKTKVVSFVGSNHSEECQVLPNDQKEESPDARRKRSVRFGDGDQLVTAVFEPNCPLANEPLNPYELAGAYKLRCDVEGIAPLYSVLAQLEAINLKDSYARRDVFTLKGTQLKGPHIELLEEVFKRVQFELLNLENTNLTDETTVALCEMVEFYESCTELCLARNPHITSQGWKSVTRLLRKLPCLRWLDVRGIPLNESDCQSLTHAIRSQAMSCRAEMSKFSKFQLANQRLLEFDPSVESTDNVEQSRGGRLAGELKRLATCPTHATVHCQQCLSQIPYQGLQGLHLGSTKVRDLGLSRLIGSIRLSSICDLRLTENQLAPSDAVFLIPLLRFGATLRYLDLSRNRLGDEGCKVIANALSSTAFPTQPTSSSATGLRRLYLADNQLTEASMPALTRALQHCTRLTCLQLGDNPRIGCSGLVSLQPGILHARQLTRLGLARCGVACIGAVALAEIMVDRPRRLSRIDLRENEVGAAGLLALGRCLKCVDRRVRIDGLEPLCTSQIQYSPNPDKCSGGLLHTVARLAGSPPQTGQQPVEFKELEDDHRYHVAVQAAQTCMQMMAENHATYPVPEKFSRTCSASRYCRIQIPSSSNGSNNPTEELDARYLWGDSSDDEDEDVGQRDVSNNASLPEQDQSVKTTPPVDDPTKSIGQEGVDLNRVVRLSDLGTHKSCPDRVTNGTDVYPTDVTDHGVIGPVDLHSEESALMKPSLTVATTNAQSASEMWTPHQWNKQSNNGTENLVSVPLV